MKDYAGKNATPKKQGNGWIIWLAVVVALGLVVAEMSVWELMR